MVFDLISLYLLAVACAVLYFAVHIRNLSRAAYTTTLLHLGFAVCFYILGYAMELNASSPAQILFWNRIEYIGIPFIAALWMTTVLIYTGRFSRHRKVLTAAIYVIPVLSMMLRLTNDYHHLYFKSIDFVSEFGRLFLVREQGPFMTIQFLHSVFMIVFSEGYLIRDVLKGPRRQTGKIWLVVMGSVFAMAGLFLPVLIQNGYKIDYMALCLPVTCLTIIGAISRYDLLETRSIARGKVFEASSDAILMMNLQNRVLDFNGSAKELFKQLDIRLENRSSADLFAGNKVLLSVMAETKPAVVKLKTGDKDRYYEITTEHIGKGKFLRGWIKTFRDVTEIYQLNEELRRLAMTDELSVLSNRRAFLKIGKEWVEHSEKQGGDLYLLMMDLDFFKNVNDRFGHPTGDLVIHEFSQMLIEHFGPDSLIARLGGEEFAVMLEGVTEDAVLKLIESLLTKTAHHTYSYFGNKFNVTVSVGMTKMEPGQQLEGMMRRADRALYGSKDRGRRCVTVM